MTIILLEAPVPCGMVQTIRVEDEDTAGHATSPTVTDGTSPKLIPTMVISVFGAPNNGATEEIIGPKLVI